MKIIKEYPGYHHYVGTWEKTSYFCPNCGEKKVWKEQGEGDFYVGPSFACTGCSHMFLLPSGTFPARDSDVGILHQLRSGITAEPKTPRRK